MSWTRPKRVLILSEQSENHGSYVAYVRQLLAESSPYATEVSVKHIYVERRYFRAKNSDFILRKVAHASKGLSPLAIFGFYDAESTTEGTWDAEVARVSELQDELNCRIDLPVRILVMNPMTESAFLLADETTKLMHKTLGARVDEKLLKKIQKTRRNGAWVNRDELKNAMGNPRARLKQELDERGADLLSRGLPPCDAPPYTRAREALRATLSEAGLIP